MTVGLFLAEALICWKVLLYTQKGKSPETLFLLVIYCHVTNYMKTLVTEEKNKHSLCHSFCASEILWVRSNMAGWFWLRVSHRTAVKMSAWAGGWASKMTHLHDWQAGADYCQGASVHFHIGLLECPHDMAAGFPQS